LPKEKGKEKKKKSAEVAVSTRKEEKFRASRGNGGKKGKGGSPGFVNGKKGRPYLRERGTFSLRGEKGG